MSSSNYFNSMYHVQEGIKSGNVLYLVIPCALSVRQIQLKCEVKKIFYLKIISIKSVFVCYLLDILSVMMRDKRSY